MNVAVSIVQIAPLFRFCFFVLSELRGEISSFYFTSANMLSNLSNLIIGSSLNSIQNLDHKYGEVLGTNPDMFSKYLSGHSASN
jgi:hypothetical protein